MRFSTSESNLVIVVISYNSYKWVAWIRGHVFGVLLRPTNRFVLGRRNGEWSPADILPHWDPTSMWGAAKTGYWEEPYLSLALSHDSLSDRKEKN
jgi:hypothetical protein